MAATSVAAPVSARLPSVRALSASRDHCTPHRDLSMICLKRSTSAPGSVAVYSSAVHTFAKSYATRAPVAHAVKPSSMRSAAVAGGQSCIHLSPAEPSLHPADTHVSVPKHVVTLKCLTIVTKTMRLVPNVRSLWRSDACVGRRPSRINNVGCKMSDVVKFVVISFAVDRISAESHAIDQASAKMRMAKLANSLAVSPRRAAVTLMRIRAMLPLPAKKKSHARARFSSPANARRKSRK